jgi:hypothetical protein
MYVNGMGSRGIQTVKIQDSNIIKILCGKVAMKLMHHQLTRHLKAGVFPCDQKHFR